MHHSNGRVLWLINHKTLMAHEVPLILQLGFEVFVPKVMPTDAQFRSGAVDFSYDSSLTIPPDDLADLNNSNFYGRWTPRMVELANRHFDAVFVIPFALLTPEAVLNFEGRVILRAFGFDSSLTYTKQLEEAHGRELLSAIGAMGSRFVFGQGYEVLDAVESPILRTRSAYLPIGAPDGLWDRAGSWRGGDGRILFVCPNVVTNDYYRDIYKEFKQAFGDLPHVIVGMQDVPVDDPTVIGFVSDAELDRLYCECSVVYYHSTEPRHVHYTPVEAAIRTTPLVYYSGSLLGELAGSDALGAVRNQGEARSVINRILGGDTHFIDCLRESQKLIATKFSSVYCKGFWEENRGLLNRPVENKSEESGQKGGNLLRHAPKRSSIFEFFVARRKFKMPDPARSYLQASALMLGLEAGTEKNHGDGFEIDFAENRLCWAVRHHTGLGAGEAFGRWTIGHTATLAFAIDLPRQIRLVIVGCAYGRNSNAPVVIIVGGKKKRFTLSGTIENPSVVTLDMSVPKSTADITIKIPYPEIPKNDSRAVGLALKSLTVIDRGLGG